MTSSSRGEKSWEDPTWQHGAFTKAILEGLAGQANYDGNETIYTNELDFYVTQHVKELTGNTQRPTTDTSTGYTAFPLFVIASGGAQAPTDEPVPATPKGGPWTNTPEVPAPDLPATATADAERISAIVAATLAALAPPTDAPTAPPAGPKLGDAWTRPADGMEMVYAPGGEFQMGSNDGYDDEKPVHTVVLDAFWLDRTEVTNAQYRRCVETGVCAISSYADDSQYNGDSQPVGGVDWNDAQGYCQWAGARLPTEAEWEYAARGPEGRVYPWGNTFEANLGNFSGTGDGYEYAAPVGSFPEGASWVGALDLSGNVWEWTADWYGPYPAERQVNPTGPDSGTYKVLRGGSWDFTSGDARGANRNRNFVDNWINYFGFRCARN